MIKKIDFNLACFNEQLEEKSTVKFEDVKKFDVMVNNLINIGISAIDFDIFTEDNIEQYKISYTDNHDCKQLINRLSMLQSTKSMEQEDILF